MIKNIYLFLYINLICIKNLLYRRIFLIKTTTVDMTKLVKF